MHLDYDPKLALGWHPMFTFSTAVKPQPLVKEQAKNLMRHHTFYQDGFFLHIILKKDFGESLADTAPFK